MLAIPKLSAVILSKDFEVLRAMNIIRQQSGESSPMLSGFSLQKK